MKKDLRDQLNKLLIQLKDVPKMSEVDNWNYGEETTDKTLTEYGKKYKKENPDCDDSDLDYDYDVNLEKVRRIILKQAITDYLKNTNQIFDMFDEYKLSGY